jgi:uncharacterized membrane protein YphA (DoxX/SURF4 family)
VYTMNEFWQPGITQEKSKCTRCPIKSLPRFWNTFFFTPTSSAVLCLFRILFGLLAFCTGLQWLPNALMWFGNSGVLTAGTLQRWDQEVRFDLLTDLHLSDPFILCLVFAYLLASLCLAIGFQTRLSAAFVWLFLLSFSHRNLLILTSGDKLMRLIAFLLIFSPAAKMFSLDKQLANRFGMNSTEESCEPWVQRLIQLQVAAFYWHVSWNKFFSPVWRSGIAAYYAILNFGHSNLPIPCLFDHLWTVQLISWTTVIVEFLLWSLIWFKPFRYWVLIAGIILHLSIYYTMYFRLFQLTMIACLITFVDPADLSFKFANRKLERDLD